VIAKVTPSPKPKMAANKFINLDEVEQLAKERMTKMAFDYYAGGAETGSALEANGAAFAAYRVVPRVLRDVSGVDTSSTLLGALVRCCCVLLFGVVWCCCYCSALRFRRAKQNRGQPPPPRRIVRFFDAANTPTVGLPNTHTRTPQNKNQNKGHKMAMPVLVAPMAMHGLADPVGRELATAAGAAAVNVPMVRDCGCVCAHVL
jgi:hypothetical protein